MAESWLEGEAVKYAKRRGWYTRKVRWLCRRGAPDRIFIRDGRNVWIEFKRPDGRGVVSGNQKSERRLMIGAGAEIYLVETVLEYEAILA
jgi:hypothetical protein